MLDAATAELIKAGLGYVLFVLSCGVIAVMWNKINNLHMKIADDTKEANKEIGGIHEKRLVESREVVLAMERNTASAVERTTAVQNQATAINDLTKGFAALVLNTDNSRQRYSEVLARIEGRQEVIVKELGEVRRELGSGGK